MTAAKYGLRVDGTPKKKPGRKPTRRVSEKRISSPETQIAEKVQNMPVEPVEPETAIPVHHFSDVPADVQNPFAEAPKPPPAQRGEATLAAEAGPAPIPEPTPEPVEGILEGAEPDDTIAPDGTKRLGRKAAAEIVEQAFMVRDLVACAVVMPMAIKTVNKVNFGHYPRDFQKILVEAEQLTPAERDILRPGLIKRLADLPVTEDEVFWYGLAIIEAKHLFAVVMAARSYQPGQSATAPQAPPPSAGPTA